MLSRRDLVPTTIAPLSTMACGMAVRCLQCSILTCGCTPIRLAPWRPCWRVTVASGPSTQCRSTRLVGGRIMSDCCLRLPGCCRVICYVGRSRCPKKDRRTGSTLPFCCCGGLRMPASAASTRVFTCIARMSIFACGCSWTAGGWSELAAFWSSTPLSVPVGAKRGICCGMSPVYGDCGARPAGRRTGTGGREARTRISPPSLVRRAMPLSRSRAYHAYV